MSGSVRLYSNVDGSLIVDLCLRNKVVTAGALRRTDRSELGDCVVMHIGADRAGPSRLDGGPAYGPAC